MRRRTRSVSFTVMLLALGAAAHAQSTRPAAREDLRSEIRKLSLVPDEPSVYAPPSLPREDEGVNFGGANLDLTAGYMTAYVYRGIDFDKAVGKHDSANAQFDGRLEFNLGRLPHPFVGVFSNIFNNDPVTRFQEFRPYLGLDLTVRPLSLEVGDNIYVFPDREDFNTSEVYARLTFDDSYLFRTDRPLFTPYIYGAYDYDLSHGFYVEAGVRHEFPIEETPLKFTVIADVAYVSNLRHQFIVINLNRSGFQHYDVGLIASYSLNRLFKDSGRFGQVSINGYLYYTGGINRDQFHGTDELWGGVGIAYHY